MIQEVLAAIRDWVNPKFEEIKLSIKSLQERIEPKIDGIDQKLDKIGQPAEGQPNTLFAAIAAGGGGGEHTTDEVYNLLLTAINKKNSVGGLTFLSGDVAINVVDAVIKRLNIYSIYDNEISVITVANAFYGITTLNRIEMTELQQITQGYTLQNCTSLVYVSFPKLESIPNSSVCHLCTSCSNLTEANFPKLVNFGAYAFFNCINLKKLVTNLQVTPYSNGSNALGGCNNLIDFTIRPIGSINISGWLPTNALLSDSNTLVDSGEPFTSNLEKLLFNIREHIAANLPTGSFTITFASAVKAAILADAATASAFTSKGWTIA